MTLVPAEGITPPIPRVALEGMSNLVELMLSVVVPLYAVNE